jgi:hypothetical protein
MDYNLLYINQKLYSIISIISEAQKIVYASRSKITTLMEGYK